MTLIGQVFSYEQMFTYLVLFALLQGHIWHANSASDRPALLHHPWAAMTDDSP
uniref:Uncharacterized protein n=1 Tax=Aegilops tauschii subsp. strangulata TaxID=200361 RepID=A0A452ZZQ7_AEGTS